MLDGQHPDNSKILKANRIPRRKKPPRLPNAASTVSNSLLTTSAKPKLDILDESKDNFYNEFDNDVEAGTESKLHHSTIQVKDERSRPSYVSSTPREKEERPRSNQTQNITNFPKRSMMGATSCNEFPSAAHDSTSIATQVVNRAQRSRARKYNRKNSSRKRSSQVKQDPNKQLDDQSLPQQDTNDYIPSDKPHQYQTVNDAKKHH